MVCWCGYLEVVAFLNPDYILLQVESTHIIDLLFQVTISDFTVIGITNSVLPHSEYWVFSQTIINLVLLIHLLFLVGCEDLSQSFNFIDLHFFLMFETSQLAAVEQIAHIPFHISYPLQKNFDIEVVYNFISQAIDFSRLCPAFGKLETLQYLVQGIFYETDHIKNRLIISNSS